VEEKNMRKNILLIAMVTVMALGVTACGNSNQSSEVTNVEKTVEITTVEETTTEEITEEPTTKKQEETTTKKAAKKKKVSKKNTETSKVLSPTEAKSIAQSYVGKTMDELVSAIGQYSSMEKAKSCLVDGEYDGMFYYDGFTVTASTENGVWIISSVD
jgi:hypothetical protein